MKSPRIAPWGIAALLLGCATGGAPDGTRHSFALAGVATAPNQPPTVIGPLVWGESCPFDNTNAFRDAARKALERAPGANALVAAKLSEVIRAVIFVGDVTDCARVEGYPAILR